MKIYNYFFNEFRYVSDEEGQQHIDSGVWKHVPEEITKENKDEKEQRQETPKEVLEKAIVQRGRPKKKGI